MLTDNRHVVPEENVFGSAKLQICKPGGVKVRLFPSSACSEQLICTAALVSAVCGKKSAASVCCYLVSELRIFQILYTVDIGIESSR